MSSQNINAFLLSYLVYSQIWLNPIVNEVSDQQYIYIYIYIYAISQILMRKFLSEEGFEPLCVNYDQRSVFSHKFKLL